MIEKLIADWNWPQYVIASYVLVMTVFWWRMKFAVGNKPAPGLKLWVFTAWAGIVYTFYAAGVWR